MELKQEPYFTEIESLSECKNHLGKELGLSQWTEITQQQINEFAKVTDDDQWIHTNPKMALEHSPYKKPIAHGFLVLSLASKFCFETLRINDIAMGLNYGLDRVRFINATPVGSLLRGRTTLVEVLDIPGGVRYKVNIVFEIKGEEKPACVAEFICQAYSK